MVSFSICEGNPGALQFVLEAYKRAPAYAEKAFQRMQNHGITGAKLYMLWNDCCGRNINNALLAMRYFPITELNYRINYEGGMGRPITEAEVVEAFNRHGSKEV